MRIECIFGIGSDTNEELCGEIGDKSALSFSFDHLITLSLKNLYGILVIRFWLRSWTILAYVPVLMSEQII